MNRIRAAADQYRHRITHDEHAALSLAHDLSLVILVLACVLVAGMVIDAAADLRGGFQR